MSGCYRCRGWGSVQIEIFVLTNSLTYEVNIRIPSFGYNLWTKRTIKLKWCTLFNHNRSEFYEGSRISRKENPREIRGSYAAG